MFQLSPAVLAQYRAQAESAFHDTVSFYTITVTRDVYGNEVLSSGINGTYPCLIGSVTGKDEEIVSKLVTEGRIKTHTAKCLVPWNANINITDVAVVSGIAGEWEIAWHNQDITDEYRLYTKVILTKDDPVTNYRDDYKRGS